MSFAFRWYRCDASVTPALPRDCVLIPGATSLTYTPQAADVGLNLGR